VPEILRKNEGGSAVDFLGRIKESALPALLRGRDGNALDLAVVETFAAMGIRVVLHDLEKGVGTRPPLPPPGGAAPRVRPSAQPSADLIERL
jgi:hypothetical protein